MLVFDLSNSDHGRATFRLADLAVVPLFAALAFAFSVPTNASLEALAVPLALSAGACFAALYESEQIWWNDPVGLSFGRRIFVDGPDEVQRIDGQLVRLIPSYVPPEPTTETGS